MKKRIILHLTAFAVVLPLVAVFNQGNIVYNILGLLWFAYLAIFAMESPHAHRFMRDYYREMLRLERMM